jgi:hypothetical protein
MLEGATQWQPNFLVTPFLVYLLNILFIRIVFICIYILNILYLCITIFGLCLWRARKMLCFVSLLYLQGVWIGVYKSADPPKFEAKSAIRQWSCLLSKFESAKTSLLWSHNPGSELNCKLNAQSEPKYYINPQSNVLIKLIRSANPCKIFARSKIRTIFSVKSDDPKTYSPPPPPPLHILHALSYCSQLF